MTIDDDDDVPELESDIRNKDNSNMQQTQFHSSFHHLRSWAISLSIFAIIVLFAQSPPDDSLTSNFNPVMVTLDKINTQVVKGNDVVVKCLLSTPHAQKNETYNPTEGTINISVDKSLAPYASAAFLDLVSSKHFDGNYIFRVVPGFIVQWGIESPRNGSSKTKFIKANIDPPPSQHDPRRSNVRGTLNFVGGNSATGQVYVNKSDNKYLDKEKGSLPFASLDKESMKIIDSVYDKYKQGSGQVKALNNDEVDKQFPNMSRIERCWISSSFER